MGNFYETELLVEDKKHLLQGDVLASIPFLGFSITDAKILYKEASEPASVNLTDLSTPPKAAQLISNVKFSYGMILNQSCDLALNRKSEKPILIARIIPANERVKGYKQGDLKSSTDKVKELANPGKTPTLFYLQEYKSDSIHLLPSVVDLLEVICIPPGDLESLATLLKLRLSGTARQALQERLAYCFGRFGAPDDLYFTDEEAEYVKNK